MCGILGIVGDQQPEPAVFAAALRTMIARGPDDEGILREPDLSLGHRRLSIQDLSPAGHQPMISADGRYAIVFNGEVYNFRELARELKDDGFILRSGSDTEVILELFVRHGPSCLPRFRGMYAIAIWDRRDRALYLARDQRGIKPLYFIHRGGTFAFASEIKALRALPGLRTEILPSAVADFLAWGSVSSPHTVFEGIECLPAGTWAVLRDGKLSKYRFWSIPVAPTRIHSKEHAIEVLRPALIDSVTLRCVSDVPVAAFLSGGIDSSAIVMLMRHAGQSALRTFSLGFPGTGLDESSHAARIAKIFDTDHTNMSVTDDMVEEGLDGFFAAMDQPTCDGVNTYFVSKFAREAGLTVALSGLGGDELFGGYPSFKRAHRAARALGFVPSALFGLAAPLAFQFHRRLAKLELLGVAGSPHARLYALSRGLFAPRQVRGLMRAPYQQGALPEPTPGASAFHSAMQLELEHYTQDQLLRDADVFGMAHTIEIRVPLIDHLLIEKVAEIDPLLLLDGQKDLLCAALPTPLPSECTDRSKMGFTFPFDRWLRTTWRPAVESKLLDSASVPAFLDAGRIAGVWRDFQAGRLHWSRPWALYALLRFLELRA